MNAVLAHSGSADEGLAIGMVFAALWIGWMGWSRLRGGGFLRLPRGAGYGLLAGALALVIGSAVVPGLAFRDDHRTSVTGPRPSSPATLAFLAPSHGAVITEGRVEVSIDLQGGTVVEGPATTVTPTEGHLHLMVDDTLVSMTYGDVQVVDLGPYGPGEHILRAEFVAVDHAPFDPPVVATVTVTVPAP